MSQELIQKTEQVRIPKALVIRIRKIAPYGLGASVDNYISYMLDEFVSQLEKTQPIPRKYNPFSEKELESVKEEIKCYSLYP